MCWGNCVAASCGARLVVFTIEMWTSAWQVHSLQSAFPQAQKPRMMLSLGRVFQLHALCRLQCHRPRFETLVRIQHFTSLKPISRASRCKVELTGLRQDTFAPFAPFTRFTSATGRLWSASGCGSSVDSATCGPELKQSLGLKSVCKTGFRSALGGRVLSLGRVLSAPTL